MDTLEVVDAKPFTAELTPMGGADTSHPHRIERDTAIIEGRARGLTYQQIADSVGINPTTALRVVAQHADLVEEVKERLQCRVMQSLGSVADNMAKVAESFDAKNNVNAAKWMTEQVMGWGPKHSTHYGDVNNTNVLTLNVAPGDLARDGNLRDTLRQSLGLHE